MPAWSARLTAAGLEAAVVAPEAGWEPRTLADFLSDLAHGSERWDGEKRWRSQDAELQLAASRPLRNTVLLVAELKDGPPTWCVRAELELDPGVFDQLAILARQLGGYPVG